MRGGSDNSGRRLSFAVRHGMGLSMIDPRLEDELRATYTRIAGVDEVGRGPWAGPVTACAVILHPDRIPEGLADSKKLTAAARERLCAQILEVAEVGIAHVDVDEIDRLNILQASLSAMRQAVLALPYSPDYALIDGNKIPDGLPCPAEGLVKGDARVASIAAASIVAKVTRDRIMVALAQQYPGYGWETNAGYGTAQHREGLENRGVTPHHRRSFKPIHNILCAAKTPNF